MSFDLVIAGVGGQPIDRMVECLAAACEAAGQAFLSTAPRGVLILGGSRVAQISVGECWSSIVTEDTGGMLLGLEAGEALRNAKYCARDGVALVDALAIPPAAPPDPRPYPSLSAIEPALREVIASVHLADFREVARKAGSQPEFAHAALLGAASRAKGLDMLKGHWKEGLKAAKASESETKAFEGGADWAADLKL